MSQIPAPWHSEGDWEFGEIETDMEMCCKLELELGKGGKPAFSEGTVLVVADPVRARALIRQHLDAALRDIQERPEAYGFRRPF